MIFKYICVIFKNYFYPKILLSSDIGNYDYNKYFLEKFSFINFDTEKCKFLDSNITYLHNIKISDLFKIIANCLLFSYEHCLQLILIFVISCLKLKYAKKQ